MGLSAPKQRNKISDDPNNNAWSRSTDRFGHKILAAQGWTPGSYLGAKDAVHAQHYTAANASHIRILLKDDNLGLGAKRGNANAETFGLGAFQGLLGRLNGKSEGELKKEEAVRRDVQLVLYQGQRWGHMNFVSGGFLVGDRIEDIVQPCLGQAQEESGGGMRDEPTTSAGSELEGKSSKKRKRTRQADAGTDAAREQEEAEKKRKKGNKERKSEIESEASGIGSKGQQEKRRKTRKTDDAAASESTEIESTVSNTPAASSSEGLALSSMDEKAERRRRRTEKKAKKEGKRLKREQQQQEDRDKDAAAAQSAGVPESTLISAADSEQSQSSTPAPNSALSFSGGRLAVRQRYIRQKKMASLDPQALREIFMIKAQV